jgi:hypothetical protein
MVQMMMNVSMDLQLKMKRRPMHRKMDGREQTTDQAMAEAKAPPFTETVEVATGLVMFGPEAARATMAAHGKKQRVPKDLVLILGLEHMIEILTGLVTNATVLNSDCRSASTN